MRGQGQEEPGQGPREPGPERGLCSPGEQVAGQAAVIQVGEGAM